MNRKQYEIGVCFIVKIIALTGGIGCGKTTAAEFFQKMGVPSINADTLCHELYSDPELLRLMAARWGEKILAPGQNQIDRKAPADIVFQNRDELDALSNMILPLAENEVKKRLNAMREYEFVLLDAPLLYEAGWDKMADCTVAVWAPDEVRRQRLMKDRNWDEQEIIRRSREQMSETEKLERADYGLINSGSRDFLEQQCRLVLEKIRARKFA